MTLPEIKPLSQVWQTPVRHAQRTGTSQASANSRRLENFAFQHTLRPLRANDTCGPEPTGPVGGCGGACDGSTTPGVIGLPEPKVSVCTRSPETPQVTSPSHKSPRNAAGPHR